MGNQRKERTTRYHVVETQTVSEDILEDLINESVEEGWALDRIQFAMHESNKRPAMAFILFTKTE